MDHLPQRSKEALERQSNTTRKGRTRPANLREQVNPETVEAWEKAQEPQMWPTPIASTGGPYKNHKGDEKKIPSRGNPLATAVAMWPTPRVSGQENLDTLIKRKGLKKALQHNLTAAVQMWPTPRARDWKMTGDVANWAESAIGDECLRRAVGRKEATPGSLNPQWVEWLMGYPEGWTDLKD